MSEITPPNAALIRRVAGKDSYLHMSAIINDLMDAARREGAQAEHDGSTEALKSAFVAGCCAVLTWTHSGMPQDDLEEAGYEYAASVLK